MNRLPDPVPVCPSHSAATHRAALGLRRYRLRLDWPGTGGGHLLEVHAHARTPQPDNRERRPVTLHSVLEHYGQASSRESRFT